jgi:1-acyl-sn-glycerol-3-phosphate acyltransferase
MFRTRHRRTPPDIAPVRRPRSAVLPALGALTPIGMWLLEQSGSVLVLALAVAVVESAMRSWEAGLWDKVFHRDRTAMRPAPSSPWSRLPHVTVSALRRALWWSAVTALGGLTVHGRAPAGPCVVVANHRSHADTPALLAALPARGRPRVAAAADHWFTRRRRRYFCRWLIGGFPVRRSGGGHADLAHAARLLASGGIVIVFPEGTRGTGPGIAPFHSGAFHLAHATGVPIVPVALVGTTDVLAKNARRPHRAPMALHFGEPLDVAEPNDTRTRITDMLRHSGTRPES